MNPGISRTGRPPLSGTPPPRHTELRKSTAASTPARLSRQSGGKEGSETPTAGSYPIKSLHVTRRKGSTLAGMRAATIRDGQIEVVEHPDPEPQDGQLLVRVKAAGLNGADMMQLAGRYPAPPGAPENIPGLELAGEGVSCGRRAGRFEPGDRVMAIVGGGGPGRRPGRARGRPRAHRDARSGGARLDRRRRGPGGLHDGPRRPLHPGRAD